LLDEAFRFVLIDEVSNDNGCPRIIVLDQRIQSMTEFKQIIGRGTRINEDYDKYYFTIIDFKKATELFTDPDFDGDPVQIYEPKANDSPMPPDTFDDGNPGENSDYVEAGDGLDWSPIAEPDPDEQHAGIRRYVVANVEVKVVAEQVQYFDANGKLMTESLKDYTRKTLAKEFSSLNDFLRRWSSAEKKQAIIEELSEEGIFFDALADEIGRQSGKKFDPFDLVCHVAWDMPPPYPQRTRRTGQEAQLFCPVRRPGPTRLGSLTAL
jgi:type I restriction enzyme, R subunit